MDSFLRKAIGMLGWALGTVSNGIVLAAVLSGYVRSWALLLAFVNECMLIWAFVELVSPDRRPG